MLPRLSILTLMFSIGISFSGAAQVQNQSTQAADAQKGSQTAGASQTDPALIPGVMKDGGLYLGKDAKDKATRDAYITKAQLWSPVNLDEMDLKAGRQTKKTLPNDASVECTYLQEKNGGTTDKFKCLLISATDANGKPLKVKPMKLKVRYSHKVFSDVISTRLTWAFGFGGDIETPVAKVICHGCGDDPFTQKTPVAGTKEFDTVSVEEKYPADGPEIFQTGARYSHDDKEPASAWYWDELSFIKDPQVKTEAAALKLYAAFIKDGDNKAVQNVFVCTDPVGSDNICHAPYLYVHDFGNVLGTDGWQVDPLNFEGWSHSKVWKDKDKCIAAIRINKGNGAGLTDPQISEAGRQLFAGLLDDLVNKHESKLRDIFDAAHIDKYVDHGKLFTTDDWVKAFKKRAAEIIDKKSPCPN